MISNGAFDRVQGDNKVCLPRYSDENLWALNAHQPWLEVDRHSRLFITQGRQAA